MLARFPPEGFCCGTTRAEKVQAEEGRIQFSALLNIAQNIRRLDFYDFCISQLNRISGNSKRTNMNFYATKTSFSKTYLCTEGCQETTSLKSCCPFMANTAVTPAQPQVMSTLTHCVFKRKIGLQCVFCRKKDTTQGLLSVLSPGAAETIGV